MLENYVFEKQRTYLRTLIVKWTIISIFEIGLLAGALLAGALLAGVLLAGVLKAAHFKLNMEKDHIFYYDNKRTWCNKRTCRKKSQQNKQTYWKINEHSGIKIQT